MRRPTKASRLTLVMMNMIATMRVEADIIESFRASFPDATSESESNFSPDFLVKRPRAILTRIATPTIMSDGVLYSGEDGSMIFSTASISEVTPA